MKDAPVLFQDSAVRDGVKDIDEVQADNIHSLFLIVVTVVLCHKTLCLQEMYLRNSDLSKKHTTIRQCIPSWRKICIKKHFHI